MRSQPAIQPQQAFLDQTTLEPPEFFLNLQADTERTRVEASKKVHRLIVKFTPYIYFLFFVNILIFRSPFIVGVSIFPQFELGQRYLSEYRRHAMRCRVLQDEFLEQRSELVFCMKLCVVKE